jgi:hypothetical protein
MGRRLWPLTHCMEWCRGTESNRRHEDFQSSALPTELPRLIVFDWFRLGAGEVSETITKAQPCQLDSPGPHFP